MGTGIGNAEEGDVITMTQNTTVLSEKRYDPNLVEEVSQILKIFDLPPDHPIHSQPLWDLLEHSHETLENRKFALQDPNTLALWEYFRLVRDYEPDHKYKSAFITLIKILILLFNTNPWARSRIGHFMWFCGCACNPDAYVPAQFEEFYGPKKWYDLGETRRPEHGGVPYSERAESSDQSGFQARHSTEDMGACFSGESGPGKRNNPDGRVCEGVTAIHATSGPPSPAHRKTRRNRDKSRSDG